MNQEIGVPITVKVNIDGIVISTELLEKIRDTLILLNGYTAFDPQGENVDKGRLSTVVPTEELIPINLESLILKVNGVLGE